MIIVALVVRVSELVLSSGIVLHKVQILIHVAAKQESIPLILAALNRVQQEPRRRLVLVLVLVLINGLVSVRGQEPIFGFP
ncbi:hypothetical protein TorRG33x02_347090 [Trema orientale]|uniref:Uncharacterized protein n=1 Tax=Trema orientale TaxID=63057 RepID=A0A2P5AM11_TREOI|nr:hypothetical protein TorRG33x02_347090 [Trema orientale]